MRCRFILLALPVLLAVTGFAVTRTQARGRGEQTISFRKIVLDTKFRSEGVAVADVNRDGQKDVLAGNLWYRAPQWTPQETAPAQEFNGATGYSNSFLNFSTDVNGDGWPDQIVVGFPGEKALWRENPKGRPGPWKEHAIWRSACNESPALADLLGNRRPVLVFPYDEKYMAWYEPDSDRTKEFVCHTVGEAGAPGVARFAHGMGIGDVTGDGRPDILCKDGYYEAPKDPRSGPWKFVRADLGPDCAQMGVTDVNGDGLPDVISSSAHNIGVWWHEQKRGPNGPEFVHHTIDASFSQSHALAMADMNGDGQMDIVTGKRFWAHGPQGDVQPNDPCLLVWYELRRKNRTVTWIRHEIDRDSGVGTQFTVTDVDGDRLLDVVTSNKKGVYVFLQRRSE